LNLKARTRRILGWSGLVAVLLLASPVQPQAASYQEIEIENGGTLTGRVRLKGATPEARYFPLVLYPFGTFCKKISDTEGNVILQEFFVSDDGGLQDAVVVIEDVAQGKRFTPIRNDFVAVDCMFHPADVDPKEHSKRQDDGRIRHEHPLVRIMQNNQPISVVNQDPIIHNGQVFQSERGNIVLNFPLPISTKPNGGIVHFAAGKRIAQMICGMHEFMQTWGFMVDNPYYAKTRKDGEFVIDQIPPGSYTVTAWHPRLKPISKQIVVRPGGAVNLEFEFDATDVKRPHYEAQEKFRIGPEAHRHGDLTGDSEDRLILR
jgi:hypothetical protein